MLLELFQEGVQRPVMAPALVDSASDPCPQWLQKPTAPRDFIAHGLRSHRDLGITCEGTVQVPRCAHSTAEKTEAITQMTHRGHATRLHSSRHFLPPVLGHLPHQGTCLTPSAMTVQRDRFGKGDRCVNVASPTSDMKMTTQRGSDL